MGNTLPPDSTPTVSPTEAEGGAGLTWTTGDANICTIANQATGALTLVGAGNCVVTVSVEENDNYEAGGTRTTSITITAVAPQNATLAAAPGNAQVTLTYTANNGGSPITEWRYQQKEGGADYGA